MKNISIALAALLLILASASMHRLINLLEANQDLKTDLAEINHIRYGLLNTDRWVSAVSDIILKKINEFQLTPENREEIREKVENILDTLILEVDKSLREENKKGEGMERFWGGVKQALTDTFVNLEDLRKDVPKYTDKILVEMSKPQNKEGLKTYLKKTIDIFADETFAKTEMRNFDAVLTRHQCTELDQCRATINQKLDVIHPHMVQHSIAILCMIGLIFIIAISLGGIMPQSLMWILVFSCVLLLLGGILTPMIEIEAKISELKLQLLGEPIQFIDQILYFQSKSITNVVSIMTQTGKPDMIMVGILISMFSIAFPALKLFSSIIYYYNVAQLRENKLVSFFTLKSGKWSMADVMVVAIFMAYIGFNGLLSSQLSNLDQESINMQVITTNGTILQIGFFMFLAFCMASLAYSSLLEARHPNETVKRITQQY